MVKQFTKKEVKLVSSLVKKGWSQGKIARKLHTRKLNVTRLMQKRGIGKRVANEFWKDVKYTQKLKEVSYKEATREVKYAPKWFKRRQKRMGGVDKARDAMKEKWVRIKRGDIDRDWWKETEGEDLMEAADYDG